MKKKNDWLFCSILLCVIVVALLSVFFIEDSAVMVGALFVACSVSSFLLGICVNEAKSVHSYNKAMDAWANFMEHLGSNKAEKADEGNPFKEFNGDNEQKTEK
jgi:hypothetical protein